MYQNKYFKYKLKYLNLKKKYEILSGGALLPSNEDLSYDLKYGIFTPNRNNPTLDFDFNFNWSNFFKFYKENEQEIIDIRNDDGLRKIFKIPIKFDGEDIYSISLFPEKNDINVTGISLFALSEKYFPVLVKSGYHITFHGPSNSGGIVKEAIIRLSCIKPDNPCVESYNENSNSIRKFFILILSIDELDINLKKEIIKLYILFRDDINNSNLDKLNTTNLEDRNNKYETTWASYVGVFTDQTLSIKRKKDHIERFINDLVPKDETIQNLSNIFSKELLKTN